MGVKKTSTIKPTRFRPIKIAMTLAQEFIGELRRRVGQGLDVDEIRMQPYSKGYARQLQRMGERADVVDMWLTGGLVGSVKVLKREQTATRATVIVGPGTGTSPQVQPPRVTRTKSGKRRKVKARATRTGGRSPAWNLLGLYHQEGRGHLPVRRWFGLSPSSRKRLLETFRRSMRPE